MNARIACLAVLLLPLLAGPVSAYDYRTLHLIEDRRTHVIIRVSAQPEDGDREERGRAGCAGLETLGRTERNIARAFGGMFQRSSIHIDKILTSRVCRQIEAARLLAIGPVTAFDVLDPVGPNGEDTGEQVERLLSFLDGLRPAETALLFAHQATIEAMTGVSLGVGEGLVFTLPPFGEPKVRGRFGLPPH
ncbi:MAG: hypothetical protein AAFX62_14110 [Pseudomonadota bacterium]